MQNAALDQIIGIICGIPSIRGQTDSDEPIDKRRAIECLFVQSTVGKSIGANGIFAIFQMMTYELIANESGPGIFTHRGRPLASFARLFVAAFDFAPILDNLLPYFVSIGDKARRHENALAKIQKSLQKW